MKKCFKCGKEKELDEFYKHPQMGDGHLNKCKECAKKDVRKDYDRKANDSKWFEKERERGREKYHRLNYRERQYEINKSKPWKNSTYKGLHKKLSLNENESAHHWNYNLIDDVIIMNKTDHRYIHRYILFDKVTLMFRTIEGILMDTKEYHLKYINSLIEFKNKQF